jgi:plastocyanin
MKSRIAFSLLVGALLLTAAACGRREPAEETAATQPAQPAAAPIDPATAGAVSGMVTLDGPAPKKRKVPMDAEPICAKQHASAVMDEEVVTGAKGELANAVVYVKDGLGSRVFETPKEPVVMDQKGCLYVPHVLAVQTNQPVKFMNSDPTTHNVHPVPTNNRDWNKSQGPGSEPIVESFAREEVAIPVKCNVHPWMKSYIAVFKHPYFQVTGKDGSFTLKNLPPGEYTIAVWHGTLGTSEQKVTLGAKETKSVAFALKPE